CRIANEVYIVQRRIVKEIRNPSEDDELGSIFKVNETNVLNKLNDKYEYLDRVQDCFIKACNEQDGTGYSYWSDNTYKAAGKTGTAESVAVGKKDDGTSYLKGETENLALVGYAPYDDPEIAFAVVVPLLGKNAG